jgi:hypothetical protein
MKNQPQPPTLWGYRSRFIERERQPGYVALDIPVYRLRFWGNQNGQPVYLLQTAPVACYRVVLN